MQVQKLAAILALCVLVCAFVPTSADPPRYRRRYRGIGRRGAFGLGLALGGALGGGIGGFGYYPGFASSYYHAHPIGHFGIGGGFGYGGIGYGYGFNPGHRFYQGPVGGFGGTYGYSPMSFGSTFPSTFGGSYQTFGGAFPSSFGGSYAPSFFGQSYQFPSTYVHHKPMYGHIHHYPIGFGGYSHFPMYFGGGFRFPFRRRLFRRRLRRYMGKW